MLFKRKKTLPEIDARAELDRVSGERGPSDLQDMHRALPPGARLFGGLVIVLCLGLASWFSWRMLNRADGHDKKTTPMSRLEDGIAELRMPRPGPDPEPPAPPPAPELPISTDWSSPTSPKIEMSITIDPVKQRRLSSPLRADDKSGETGGSTGQGTAEADTARVDTGPMADKLQPLQLAPARASMLGNRDMLLTAGMRLDCILLTKLVSTQSGLLTCIVPFDVFSDSGRVILIDAGSVLTGYKVGELAQGQSALFATWTRLRTPAGVTIELNSPATGPLGEAGISGYMDTHFGERFGNAILFSLVGDFGAWLSERGSSNGSDGGTSIRMDNTREGTTEIVGKVLEKSIDIPPTLYKNQGERIGVTIARDLDFSSVYELRTRRIR